MNVVLRGNKNPVALAGAVRQQIHELNPDLPLYNVSTMQDRFDKSLSRRRFIMLVLGAFGAISLGLAVVGIYGLITYLVGQGSREVGIRLALGATRANIMKLIVSGGMSLAFWGVGIGIGGALVVSRLMRSLLFGVGAMDRRNVCRCSHTSGLYRFSRQLYPSATRFPHRSCHVDAVRIDTRCVSRNLYKISLPTTQSYGVA